MKKFNDFYRWQKMMEDRNDIKSIFQEKTMSDLDKAMADIHASVAHVVSVNGLDEVFVYPDESYLCFSSERKHVLYGKKNAMCLLHHVSDDDTDFRNYHAWWMAYESGHPKDTARYWQVFLSTFWGTPV